MKNLILLLVTICSLYVRGQNQDLNKYQYILVQNQYDFQSEPNEYRLNDLAVFELKKRNFNVLINSNLLPKDINPESCDVLHLKMDESGTLKRYLTLRLENCSGSTVFETKEGVGTTKSNQKAYFEALRDAMTSFDTITYTYNEVNKVVKQELKKAQNLTVVEKEKNEAAPSFKKEINDTKQSTGTDRIKAVKEKMYRTKSKEYFIISTETGFDIYKNKGLIGTLKKSKGGCYFVETTDFMGVAYETSKGISIEYSYYGKDEVLEFIN
ncbi:hypothetical protein [Nonlabens sp.]|uniref:hypothetical protein n=1 Tax=Nonlabens sp. TaxID=1888209 RepID=UPI00321AC53F